MVSRRYITLSKFLTLVLRHKPDILQLHMTPDGFVSVNELVKKIRKRPKFNWVTVNDVLYVVKHDEKGRFEIKEKDGKLYIRARYGHSAELPIEVEYEKVSADDVDYLYHGTRADVLPWILREGLKPMRRKYVHLTKNPQTALIMAKRHKGKPVILKIDAKKFIQDGGEIFKASDEIYLTKYIPPKYIKIYKYGE